MIKFISKKHLAKVGVAVAAAAASTSALAQAVDVADAVSAISGGTTAVAAIGVACLAVLGGAVVFKLVRRAM